MAKESRLKRQALRRRRVHQSWKWTGMVALFGGALFVSADLVSGIDLAIVLFALFLLRPIAELYFSATSHCPHCQADVFMELCRKELAGGVEEGLICAQCGKDCCVVSRQNGPLVEVD